MNEKTETYISERMKDFAQNIDEFSAGDKVIDSDKSECVITNKSLNSIEVFIKKKNEKHGIDCWQWFDMKSFNNRFKKVD